MHRKEMPKYDQINTKEGKATEFAADFGEPQILISKSKLEDILTRQNEKTNKDGDLNAPLGIMIAIAVFFLTTDFKEKFLGLSKDTWSIFLIFLFVLSTINLCKAAIAQAISRKKNIRKIISGLKKKQIR